MKNAYKDKATGKWKTSPKGEPIYETKEQAQRAWIDNWAERLREVRNKYNEGVAGYGR